MPELTEPDPTRPATLADVARLADVAVSTVSRALSNPGRVNAATRLRVEAAARQLHYVANSSARALSSGRTGTIAVLVSDITNPFFFDIIRGTQLHLKTAGYAQLLVDTDESAELESTMATRLRQTTDGAILTAPRLSDDQLRRLSEATPLVTINRPRVGVGSVIIDTAVGVEQAVEHLASLGHKELVYINGPRSSWSNERRWRAAQRASLRLGLKTLRTSPFAPTKAAGPAAADAVINTRATACLAFNDLIAIGMLARFTERGISVPRDVSLVGCDDIFGADFCNPPLTTLTAPVEQAGRMAVAMLLSQIKTKEPASPTSTVLSTHLTVRRSTGPVPRAVRKR